MGGHWYQPPPGTKPLLDIGLLPAILCCGNNQNPEQRNEGLEECAQKRLGREGATGCFDTSVMQLGIYVSKA